MITERLDSDLKAAMLAGDKELVMTLRTIKSALLYVAVEKGVRDQGLSDEDAIAILQKEAKKRAESAEMYTNAGEAERAAKELAEKEIIATYLPAPMNEDELKRIIESEAAKVGGFEQQNMGKIIGGVKAATKGTADGALIASLVKAAIDANK
jgi:uncharacterized protein YqeY